MSKKTKQPKAESLVNSILEDLQLDQDESLTHANSSSDSSSSSDSEFMSESTRHLPEGLDSDDIFGHQERSSKSKDSTNPFDLLRETSDTNSIEKSAVDLSENSTTRKLGDERTLATSQSGMTDRTQPMHRKTGTYSYADQATKVSHGFSRPLTKSSSNPLAGSTEMQMLQAEHLRLAQSRILELEREVEHLRQENELLASAGEIAKNRAEELSDKFHEVERNKIDALDHAKMEMNIYRENAGEKDRELTRLRHKIEDLETRLAKDLKKIRVRERELENRLELAKMEKTALIRAKDDAILDLKNKLDHLHSELENYKHRCAELGQKIDGQNDQLGRTVRALRLALTHLEANDSGGNVTPLKKAE